MNRYGLSKAQRTQRLSSHENEFDVWASDRCVSFDDLPYFQSHHNSVVTYGRRGETIEQRYI